LRRRLQAAADPAIPAARKVRRRMGLGIDEKAIFSS